MKGTWFLIERMDDHTWLYNAAGYNVTVAEWQFTSDPNYYAVTKLPIDIGYVNKWLKIQMKRIIELHGDIDIKITEHTWE